MVGKYAKVINPVSLYYGRSGRVVLRADWSTKPTFKLIFIDGITEDWNYFNEEELLVLGTAPDGCQCGCSAVGSKRHSYYCNLYSEDQYD